MPDKYAGIWEKMSGPAWVARHGLTGDQYQALFDTFVPQGYRPTVLDAYNVGSEPFYLAVLEKRSGPAFVARHGLTPAQYQALFDELVPKGYRPTALSGYTIGGEPRFVAAFEQRSGPAFVARHGMNGAEYQAFISEYIPKGYRPVVLNGYTAPAAGGTGTDAYYIAHLEQMPSGPMELRHGLSAAAYQALFDDLVPKGYRPTIISGYAVNNTPQYVAVFEKKAGPDFVARHEMNGSQYQAVWDEFVPKGYRPTALTGFNSVSHLRIDLSRVHCGNTEDKSGADSLYIVGAASDGNKSQGVLTTPMHINDNQEKTFNPAQSLVFDSDIDLSSSVKVGLRAYDEDFAKDWSNYGGKVQKISDGVANGLKTTKDPKAVAAGTILEYGIKAFSFLASLDKDDFLGEHKTEVSLSGPPMEERTWHFWNDSGIGLSTWNYSVVLRIQRS